MASCEYAIASIKLSQVVVVYTPNLVPIIEFAHKYHPPSVIVPFMTQVGFVVTSELVPTVTKYYWILTIQPVQLSSMLTKSVDFMDFGCGNVTFQY
jgi:hypothetical protein